MEIKNEKLQKKIDFVKGTQYASRVYPEVVEHLIEQRYNIKQEIAINRQRDEKPTQFQEYNAYCEQCKVEAKRILGLEVISND